MKKVLSVILALCLLGCGLAACSQGSSSDPVETNEAVASTDKYRNFYQIWIGSFCDSNGDETGDFQGIISQMDYLNDGDPNTGDDLGIDGIWLSPMMPSVSYHKYNVRDYFDIDEEFGTLDDFDEFLALAHERGIKVIIDLVLNHSGSDHEFFVKACEELKEGKEDGYARYYNFSKESNDTYNREVVGTDYYYEGAFSYEMPDWNLSFEGTRAYFEEVTKFWLDRGVDGFRLDAVKYFDDSHTDGVEFLKWFYEMAQSYNPDVYMVGEDWDDAGNIYDMYESGIDSLFNFKFATTSGDFVIDARSGLVQDLMSGLKKYDGNIKSHNENAINANFLTNHDMPRVANALTENELKFAALLYMLAPGNSFTYYGEEIGIEAPNTTNDASYRTAMIWDNDNLPDIYVNGVPKVQENELGGVKQQLEQEGSLLNTYRKIIRLKLENPEIARGDITETVTFDDTKCAGMLIEYDGTKVLVIHNGNDEEKSVTIDMLENPELRGWIVAGTGEDGEDITSEKATLSADGTLTMPARSSVVIREN